jgi:hypothetical protein
VEIEQGFSMAGEKDLVLIYFEDKPLLFARIEDISPDIKPNWYQVRLLLLQVPLQVVTWILREAYIDGADFTMNGKKMRLEKVEAPEAPPLGADQDKSEKKEKPEKAGRGNVITLSDLKKK